MFYRPSEDREAPLQKTCQDQLHHHHQHHRHHRHHQLHHSPQTKQLAADLDRKNLFTNVSPNPLLTYNGRSRVTFSCGRMRGMSGNHEVPTIRGSLMSTLPPALLLMMISPPEEDVASSRELLYSTDLIRALTGGIPYVTQGASAGREDEAVTREAVGAVTVADYRAGREGACGQRRAAVVSLGSDRGADVCRVELRNTKRSARVISESGGARYDDDVGGAGG